MEKHRQYAKKNINLKSVVSFNTITALGHKHDSRGTKSFLSMRFGSSLEEIRVMEALSLTFSSRVVLP